MSAIASTYTIPERIYRTAVFQHGVDHQPLEHSLIKLIEMFRQMIR